MDRITPFTLSVSDLTNLGQDRAVEFFRRLLWAEGGRVGVGKNLIEVPQCINVGDGGIDAIIKDAQPLSGGIIPHGTSGFQIKSSDLYPNQCRKELHQGKNLSQPIKPEVKKILDGNGTYILVLFANITAPKEKTKREEAIREELKKLGYSTAKVRIYTANQLAGFAEQFPALVSWLKGDSPQCLPYSSWAERSDIRTPRTFVCDSERENYIKNIREKLRDPNEECPVFRIIGLPGIGKTRLVFEALSPDDLKNRVIFTTADQFQSSNLHIALQNNRDLSAIIVIDECDLQQHDEFVRSFSGRGSRLAVITISHEISNVPPPSLLCRLNPLGGDSIEKILATEAPTLPENVVSRLSKFSDGYPRIAVLMAESYRTGPISADEFLIISDELLMNRLIAGLIDINSDYFRKTKRVLTGLSLFQKVGYEGRLAREAEWLANYFCIPWNDFSDIVSEQRRRGIIKGQYYIYVTPFMLRVHLLKEWWENQGFTKEDFLEFINIIPQELRVDLIQRFFDHMPYITTTERGKEFAQEVLSENGIFANGSLLRGHLGANFFLKLAEADPESALACLKRTVGTWSKEKLLQFTIGRREVVWALEKIAMWRHLFSDAARLLLALGEAENETWGNNASGVFAELFSTGYGHVAPTEASPGERFVVLKEALESNSKERRLLALRACDQALESQHFVRTIGAEQQGLRKEPQLWMPKTYGELFDAYRMVWQLLLNRLDSLPEDEQQQAVNILLQRARGLGRIQNLADMVIDTIDVLIKKPYVEKKKVLAEVVRILHYEGKKLPAQTRKRWERLKDELTGNDFSSLMRRYVGMNLLEDKFDEKGNLVDQTQPQIEKLAQQAVENKSLLQPELSWLVTIDAQNGYRFGYELGKRDKDFLLLPILLDTQREAGEKASAYFLGGYFRVLFEKDQRKWETQLDALMDDVKLNIWIPELTWRSGMSDHAGSRILNLAQRNIIASDHFRMFSLGGAIRDLSEDILKEWIEFLLSISNTDAVSTALELCYSYYICKESKHTLPQDLALKLLTHPLLFQKPDTHSRDQMEEYYWTEIGEVFVQLYPEKSLEIAENMLEHFGTEGSILDGIHTQTLAVLDKITKRYPLEIWERVTKYLGPPIDSRAFHITKWLRGKGFSGEEEVGVLPIFPLEKIWEWVDEDVENRAWYLASFVPKTLFREEGKICLAREVLIRYGAREDVRRNLMANFSTEGWWGPASLHYNEKKRQLLNFKKEEDDENVKRWVDEYINSLEREIDRAKIEEERRGF